MRGFLRERENATFENFENPDRLSSSRSSDRCRRHMGSTGTGAKDGFRTAAASLVQSADVGAARGRARVKRGVREGEMETFENSDSPNRLSSSRSSDPWVRRGDWRGAAQTTDS